MDQSAYGGVPSYAPMGGYGSSGYGRYDDRNMGHAGRQRDGRFPDEAGRHASGDGHTGHVGQADHSNMASGSGIPPYGMEMHAAGSSSMGAGPGVVTEGLLTYETSVCRDSAAYGPSAMISAGYPIAGAGGDMAAQQTFFAASPGDGRSGGHPEEVRLTPVTRRVSRAKKGVPVHTCDTCNPPKVFTRAEHLRRHKLSHETPHFQCTFPHCRRSFHRADLLNRHERRHRSEEEPPPGDGIESGQSMRRGSSQSIDSSLGTTGGSLYRASSASSSVAKGSGSGGYHSAYSGEGGGEGQETGAGGGQHHDEGGKAAADEEQHYHQQYQHQFSYSSSGGVGFGHGDQVNNTAAAVTKEHDAVGQGHAQYGVESEGRDGGQTRHLPCQQQDMHTATWMLSAMPPGAVVGHTAAAGTAGMTSASVSTSDYSVMTVSKRRSRICHHQHTRSDPTAVTGCFLPQTTYATFSHHLNAYPSATTLPGGPPNPVCPQADGWNFVAASPLCTPDRPVSLDGFFFSAAAPYSTESNLGWKAAVRAGETNIIVAAESRLATMSDPILPTTRASPASERVLLRQRHAKVDDSRGSRSRGNSSSPADPVRLSSTTSSTMPSSVSGTPPPPMTRAVLLDVYWEEFDPIFPVVHRPSFEEAERQRETYQNAGDALLQRQAMEAMAALLVIGRSAQRELKKEEGGNDGDNSDDDYNNIGNHGKRDNNGNNNGDNDDNDNNDNDNTNNDIQEDLLRQVWQVACETPNWSVELMQTVFLCELLVRIRSGGRAVAGVVTSVVAAAAAAARPSQLFASLYSRVSSPGSFAAVGHAPVFDISSSSLSPLYYSQSVLSGIANSPSVVPNTTFLTMPPAEQVVAPTIIADSTTTARTVATDRETKQPHIEIQWHLWIQVEARRRLWAACFFLDTRTSLFCQALSPHPTCTDTMSLVNNVDTAMLWRAASAAEWAEAGEAGSANGYSG